MTVPRSRRFAFLMIVTSLLGASACTDRTVSPLLAPAFDAHGGDHRDRPDCDGKGHGRSGDAAITVQAMYAADGSTDIVITSYAAADTAFTTPAGCITKVDVRVYEASGSGPDRPWGSHQHHDNGWDGKDHWVLKWVRHVDRLNAGSTYTIHTTGLRSGMRVEVEARVGCLGGRRGDDVEAQTVVVRRTDPALTALRVPASAPANLPVLISATVRELNGQQGASGTCYLLVGSALTDSLPNRWVAAGDSVACNFAPTFATTGTRLITVRFGNVTPRDDDPANNSASASLLIVSPGGGTVPPITPLPFIISANVYDDTAVNYNDVYLMSQRLASDPSVLWDTTAFRNTAVGGVQFAAFNGIIYEAVPFPLVNLSVSQASGTTTYHSAAWTNLASNVGGGANSTCASLPSTGVTLVICSYQPDAGFPNGRTAISYQRADSNVTGILSAHYVDYSSGTGSACDPTSTDPTQPCYTIGTLPRPTALRHYQSSFTFSLVVETPTRKYAALVTVPLTEGTLDQGEPYACGTSNVTGGDLVTVVQRVCRGTVDTRWRKGGHVEDLVALTQLK